VYIHNNPVYHGLARSAEEWEFSSYWEILNRSSNMVRPQSAMQWIENKEKFLQLHKLEPEDFGRKTKTA
jgi:putative transposase